MPEQSPTNCRVDVAVVGGGIAGLWLLNRLCDRGYNAVLLDHGDLGDGQTMASQGMIHGGIKYTLGGALTGASEAIAEMPDHWRACLRGEGDVDLRGARVLSDHFYLWSTASLGSRLSSFFASKATRGRVEKVRAGERPELFQRRDFKGNLYRLVDMVMDAPSVVRALAENHPDRLFRIDWDHARWHKGSDGVVTIAADGDRPFTLEAKTVVLTAGEGNDAILRQLESPWPAMQRRPLKQAMVQLPSAPVFYGHCLGADTTPRLTVSSHPMADGSQVWYLGGSLAERGASQSDDELIDAARRELNQLLPWLDLKGARWEALPINRAEPRQRQMTRPDQAFAEWATGVDNVIAAWPTKLTLSPNLADRVEKLLAARISASGGPPPALPLPRPSVSPTPWAKAFGVADATA